MKILKNMTYIRMSMKKSFLIDDILDLATSKSTDDPNNKFYFVDCKHFQYANHIQKFYSQRSPRIQFSFEQLFILEKRFNQSHYLNKNDVKYLSLVLNLSDKRVFFGLIINLIKFNSFFLR